VGQSQFLVAVVSRWGINRDDACPGVPQGGLAHRLL